MIKAVLFDLDNTLMNFLWMKEQAINNAIFAMLDSSSLNLRFGDVKDEIYGFYKETNMEDPKVFQKFLEKHNAFSQKNLAKGVIAYRKAKSANMIPYPSVKRTLVKLKEKGLRLGVVSDAPSKNAWRRLVELGIEDFFDVVVTYDDTGKHKPSDLPFKKAIETLKIDKENILFVGDNPKRDVKGAKDIGMKSAFAKYGYYTSMLPLKPWDKHLQEALKENKPDFILEKFDDLLKVV